MGDQSIDMVQRTDDVGGASAEADSCKSARLALILQECETCVDVARV
jgi:hypothetical protein